MSRVRVDFDVVVVGAGAVGATLAALLSKSSRLAGGRVALIAPRWPPPPPSDWDLRVFALSRASERILAAAGIWPSLSAHRVSSYERMRVWDAAGSAHGSGSLEFDCAQLGEANLGYIVDGAELQWRCLEAAKSLRVSLIDSAVIALDADAEVAALTLDDGRVLTARLVVGADGTDSTIRELAGLGSAGHAYHQEALVAHIHTVKSHQRTAWQRFLPSGPLAFLPLSDGRSSLVWSTSCAEAKRLQALPAAEFSVELTRASDAVLGDCSLGSERACFPLKLKYAERYIAVRLALVGDAAHVVHPLAGQGLNLGLLDVASLIEVLETKGPDALGDAAALRRYERWRRSENLLTAAGLDGLERLFSSTSAVTGMMRKRGLSLIERLPPLKRRLARQALGLAGDIPALARRA
ncbi:MAG TPA: FAD-dependent monooxygenase [Steroidobacteraceae bacterium]|jgi:2-octaprenylphenol hydroxylase